MSLFDVFVVVLVLAALVFLPVVVVVGAVSGSVLCLVVPVPGVDFYAVALVVSVLRRCAELHFL